MEECMRKLHGMVSLSFSLFAALFATACSMGPGGGEAVAERGLEQGKGSNACAQGVAGDGKSCQDLGSLKLEAYNACQEAGLSLVDIEYIHGACGADAKLAQYECCPPPPPPPAPDPDPTPVPGPSDCSYGTVGDGATCTDPGALKNDAYAICTKAGLDLVDFAYSGGDCGWQTTIAKYACCPSAPSDPAPEPDPVACTGGALGDGVLCQDLSIYKLAASDACTQAGLVLTSIDYGQEGCPSGQSYKAAYVCCEAAPKSP
jgi:hypothetical protein